MIDREEVDDALFWANLHGITDVVKTIRSPTEDLTTETQRSQRFLCDLCGSVVKTLPDQ